MSDSTYEHNPGNGNMFPNPNQTPENNQPKYSGTIKLQDGKLQQIACWVKEGPKGKYFSLKLSDPYVKPENSDAPVSTPTVNDGLDF
jgi:hypothetical protein